MASIENPDLIELERLGYQNLNDKQFAEYFGINVDAFNHFREKNPEIHKAIVRGKSRSIDDATRTFMEKVMSGNIHALMFFLKTKGEWTEPKEEEPQSSKKAPSGFTLSERTKE